MHCNGASSSWGESILHDNFAHLGKIEKLANWVMNTTDLRVSQKLDTAYKQFRPTAHGSVKLFRHYLRQFGPYNSPAERFHIHLTSSHGRDAEAPTFQNQLRLDGVEGHHDDDC